MNRFIAPYLRAADAVQSHALHESGYSEGWEHILDTYSYDEILEELMNNGADSKWKAIHHFAMIAGRLVRISNAVDLILH